jgi:hypothetical protein
VSLETETTIGGGAPVSTLTATIQDRGWAVQLTADDPSGNEWGLRELSITVQDGGELIDDEGLRWLAASLPGLMGFLGTRAPLVGSDTAKVAAVKASGPEGEQLVRVADAYMRAVRAGTRPVVAVERELGLTKTTANRRVRAAREMGLLPPTKQMQGKGESK